MKRVFVSFLIFVFTASCAHQREKQFEKHLSEKDCDKALEKIPYKPSSQEIPGGKAMSYGATAVGYTADVVITVVGGVLIFTALCGPTMAAMMASRDSSFHNVQCIPADLSGIKAPRIGKTMYEETQRWRCPELTKFSESLRKVAACYESEGSKLSLEKASRQVEAFRTHTSFNDCVKVEEKTRIEDLRKELNAKLSQAS